MNHLKSLVSLTKDITKRRFFGGSGAEHQMHQPTAIQILAGYSTKLMLVFHIAIQVIRLFGRVAVIF